MTMYCLIQIIIPLKLCLIKNKLDIHLKNIENSLLLLYYYNWFYYRQKYRNYENQILLNLEKRQYIIPHYWSDKGFKGTVVCRTLPYHLCMDRHLQIKFNVPLMIWKRQKSEEKKILLVNPVYRAWLINSIYGANNKL